MGILFGGGALVFKNLGKFGAEMGIASLIFFYLFVFAWVLGFMVINHGYFIYLENRYGRTWGKKIFGLTVVTDDGDPLTLKKCFFREIFRYIDMLVIPGIISWAVTERRQRIGDIMAGTFVTYSKKQESSMDGLYMKTEDYNYIYEVAQPVATIETDLMHEYLQFSNLVFLSTSEVPDKIRILIPGWETKIRPYFQGEQQQRLDQTTALLFFAEYCCRLLRIEEEKSKTKKG